VPLLEIPDNSSARKRLLRADRLRRLSNAISLVETDAPSVLAITDARGAKAARSLGRSLAELSAAQRPTVLVYADNAGGNPGGSGFNEALSNANLATVMLQKDPNSSLQILPAGEYVTDSYGLVSKERVYDIIESLRSIAEMTIIVTPSITEAPEAELLCGAADWTLLVADSRTARAADVRYAIERLSETRADLMGTVLFHGVDDDATAGTSGHRAGSAAHASSAPEHLST
jgi:hypothetical protein